MLVKKAALFDFSKSPSSPIVAAVVQTANVSPAEAPASLNGQALVTAVIFTALAVVAVALRWYSRAYLSRVIKLEDWLILVSLVLSVAMTAVISVEVNVATDKRTLRLEVHSLEKIAQLVLCSNILYQILVNVTRSSFIVQYLRLFHDRSPRYFCCAVQLVLVIAASWGMFGGIFICRPIRKYWEPEISGTCMNAETYWLSTAGIGIAMDFVIWIIPMPLIGRLRLPFRQKLSVVAVFALGGFVCVVSVLRLALVHMYAVRGDMEHSGVAAIVWSTIEANVGIICASLMVMKPLIAKVFPSLLDAKRPSPTNMRLPTISDNTDWAWQSTNDTKCVASRPTSKVHPPACNHDILVTMDSIIEEKRVVPDEEQALMRPGRAYSWVAR